MKILFTIFTIIILSNNLFSQELNRYTSFVDRVYIKEFEKMKGKSFDKNGIIKQNKRYHPLTISQYGVLCYNEFIETNDSVYFQKCLAQVEYFKDSSKINFLFDGKGIGLPYNFKAHDLKAPWYSGMTQGYAASFLLRYYQLTNDKEILPIIEKIIYVLKQPQNEGGTISVNKEGYKWIEEYPNSKRAPQVLNGAINGLIGLKEYCDYFPGDTSAFILFKELYKGLKATIPKYDLVDWSCYCRKSKKLSNLYMRYEINEMEQLYDMFEDEFFHNQLMIWSTFVYNKPNKGSLYKRGYFNYSVPLKRADNIYKILFNKIDTVEVNYSQGDLYTYKRKSQVINSFKKEKIKKRKYKNPKYQFLKFDSIFEFNTLELRYEIGNIDFEILKYENGKLNEVPYKLIYNQNDKIVLEFDKLNLNDLVFKSKNLSLEKIIDGSSFISYSMKDQPFFSHYMSDVYNLKKGEKIHINFDFINARKVKIFYKRASTNASFKKTTWKSINYLESFLYEIEADGFCQFLIIFDLDNLYFEVSNLKFEIINNPN